MKLFALEACASCQTPSSQPAASGASDTGGETKKFTYDEGEGIKDKIVISGPLSKYLREAMNLIFVKKNTLLTDDSPQVDSAIDNMVEKKTAATESQQQDAYIANMIKTIEDTPGLNVVLSEFDYEAQDAHVKAVANGDPLNQAHRDPAIIPLYVARAEDLARPDIYEQLANMEDMNVVVVSGVDTSTGDDKITDVNLLATGKGITRALKQSDKTHVIADQDAQSNLISAAALERCYEGTKVRLYFGMESFGKELASYHQSKK